MIKNWATTWENAIFVNYYNNVQLKITDVLQHGIVLTLFKTKTAKLTGNVLVTKV